MRVGRWGQGPSREVREIAASLLADPSLGLTEAEALAIAAGDEPGDDDRNATPSTATPLRADHAGAAMAWLRSADPEGLIGAALALGRIADSSYDDRERRAADLTAAHGIMALLGEQRRTNELLTELLTVVREQPTAPDGGFAGT